MKRIAFDDEVSEEPIYADRDSDETVPIQKKINVSCINNNMIQSKIIDSENNLIILMKITPNIIQPIFLKFELVGRDEITKQDLNYHGKIIINHERFVLDKICQREDQMKFQIESGISCNNEIYLVFNNLSSNKIDVHVNCRTSYKLKDDDII
jgi:hypothetical protein